MQSPYNFIVKPVGGNRYNNTVDFGGIDFIVNTSEESHKHSNRQAEVIAVPKAYTGPIKPGDILLVHHNVFKFYNDMKGRRKSGKSFFRDDLFLVDMEQFYMYHNGDDWSTHDRYCFVKPIKKSESLFSSNNVYEPLVAEMAYPNDYLRSIGVNKGDIVIFKPDSEYEFNVDGQVMYRMYDHQIVAKK